MRKENEFYQFMCRKLLGDGCIIKQTGRKPRFQFMHRVEDFEWTNHCYEILKSYLPLNPPVYKKVIDLRLKKGFSESYVVQSKTSSIITSIYEQWYPKDRKKLPTEFLKQYLNAKALAWWYQDDGHTKIVNNVAQKIILSTDGFTKEENIWLSDYLFRKFHLKFLRDGQNRLILYDQFQIIYFLHLISTWIHESMDRKKLPEQRFRPIAKRTTIYLPAKILQKPTLEINDKLHLQNSLLSEDTGTICLDFIFDAFKPIRKKNQHLKSY